MSEPDRDKAASPRRLGVREFRSNMAGYLRQARHGSTFVIMAHDEVLAEIHPPSKTAQPRRPGALRGRIRMADDFDALPPDLLDALEGKGA